ncbi:hypothetical protein G4B88_002633 [Cannabis sativa]|uniref:Reverse transcriptase zinc-binding domain-containing protein n=1 Tax=Cannabis sativa TaxID=3483 RepID=A0A7J6IAU6_CANSA|nr:hypothetical protein G4B88_002633 [Cannabis sativa]
METDTLAWDVDLVHDMFNERDANLILIISLSSSRLCDVWYWSWKSSGHFLVKSVYMFLQLSKELGAQDDDSVFWNTIWKLSIPLKVKDLLWHAATNCLATKSRLCSRHVPIDTICLVCKVTNEIIYHCLVDCSFAKAYGKCPPSSISKQLARKNGERPPHPGNGGTATTGQTPAARQTTTGRTTNATSAGGDATDDATGRGNTRKFVPPTDGAGQAQTNCGPGIFTPRNEPHVDIDRIDPEMDQLRETIGQMQGQFQTVHQERNQARVALTENEEAPRRPGSSHPRGCRLNTKLLQPKHSRDGY